MRARGLVAAWMLAAACAAQDAGAAIREMESRLAGGEVAAARQALAGFLDAAFPDRPAAIASSVETFRNAGATDAWLDAAQARMRARADDVALAFYAGVVLQDLKLLRAADEVLGRAHRLAPDNPAIQERWAWNARWRLAPDTALDRARGATFQGAEEFRADQAARVGASRAGRVALGAILGAALSALAALYMIRGRHACAAP